MPAPKGTALITGASAGIGATYADRLARRGYDLILVARDAARMEKLAAPLRAETGRIIEVLAADLTDRADLAKVEARLASDAAISILINNAGMSLPGSMLDADISEVERLIALNVRAPTLLAAAAAKAFVARKAGTIVILSSVLALAPEKFDGAYSGSKAYLLNLGQWLTERVGASGVHVQVVLPGATRTEIWERSGIDPDAMPADMMMEVGDLVDAALLGLDRGETVSIPPLADEGEWEALQAARLAMGPNLSRRDLAPRYRDAVPA